MTDVPKPGDFPIGSIESRAAMRAMILHENDSGIRVQILLVGHPHEDCAGKWCSGPCGLTTGMYFVNEDGQVERK